MEGGVVWSDINGMKRKDFIWLFERVAKQKKDENAEIEKSRKKASKPAKPQGRSKYLNATSGKKG